jgi:hypothetical protein
MSKVAKHEAHFSLLYSAQVKNVWSFTSTSHMSSQYEAWKHKDNFAFSLFIINQFSSHYH